MILKEDHTSVIWKKVSILFIVESLALVISREEISHSWPSGFGETLLKEPPFGGKHGASFKIF